MGKARMGKAVKIVLVIMITLAMVEASDVLQDMVKNVMTEMERVNRRLAIYEETIKLTNTELLKTQEELARTKMVLKRVTDDHKTRDQKFEREQPYFHVCGAHFGGREEIVYEKIAYDSIEYSSTNVAGGGLDISTGVLTSGRAGTYTVTWSLIADAEDGAGNNLNIYLRKNRQNVCSSQLFTGYTNTDVAGRTTVLHLDHGDTLDLFCEKCKAHFHRTTFCVSLSTPDTA